MRSSSRTHPTKQQFVPVTASWFHSSPALIARCLATRSRVPQAGEQYRRAAPRPTFTNGRPQDGAAHSPAGDAWRSASSTASARQEEVRNHSAQGASSSPSTCRCQPDVPSWLVSRGGWAWLASSPLRRSAAVPASPAAKTSRRSRVAWRSSARSAAEISMGSGSPYCRSTAISSARPAGRPGPGSSTASRSAARCAASCTLLPNTGS